MQFGLERFLEDPALRAPLKGRRVALLAHPASVTRDLTHSLDALAALPDVKLSAAFGPQHGLRGDKQDNMVESPDYTDPLLGIPVFSLYGEVRRPTIAMMDTFDVLRSICKTWAAASTPSSPRCAMCSKPPRHMARRFGCWIAPTRSAARWKD